MLKLETIIENVTRNLGRNERLSDVVEILEDGLAGYGAFLVGVDTTFTTEPVLTFAYLGEQEQVHVNAWTWGKHAIIDADKVDWERLEKTAQAGARAFAEEKEDNEKQWDLFLRYEN